MTCHGLWVSLHGYQEFFWKVSISKWFSSSYPCHENTLKNHFMNTLLVFNISKTLHGEKDWLKRQTTTMTDLHLYPPPLLPNLGKLSHHSCNSVKFIVFFFSFHAFAVFDSIQSSFWHPPWCFQDSVSIFCLIFTWTFTLFIKICHQSSVILNNGLSCSLSSLIDLLQIMLFK